MTTKAAFSPDEWTTVLEAPTSAGRLGVTASRGGTFKETFAMSKAYAEARVAHTAAASSSTRSWDQSPRWITPDRTRQRN